MVAKSGSGKIRTVFRCAECGAGSPKWSGRCASCGAWNTLAEEIDAPVASLGRGLLAPTSPATPIDQISAAEASVVVPTNIAELDRVLGGGLVPGSVTLVGGEPGIGKSTLLLQLLGSVAASGQRALLVSGEESRNQVAMRAARLNAVHSNLWLAAETSLPEILAQIESVRPELVVIDSIQTMHDPAMASAPGSVGQVRECANALVRLAKDRGITTILVGHVTKEGSLAGPRILEHVVDTVLAFEGDRHHALRLLRAVKHRFGATGELGLFEMVEEGLIGVADPAAMFLGDRKHGASGSVATCAMEGARPLLVETQALVSDTSLSFPRRVGTGVDPNRMAVMIAVLEQRAGMKRIPYCDVYAGAVGGARINEPAVDLALALAMASAYSEIPFPAHSLALGEVGLAGEVRSVAHIARRLNEARRIGFETAIVPKSCPDIDGLHLIRVPTLGAAITMLGYDHPSEKGARGQNARNNGQAGQSGKRTGGGNGGNNGSEEPTNGRTIGGRSRGSERELDLYDDNF